MTADLDGDKKDLVARGRSLLVGGRGAKSGARREEVDDGQGDEELGNGFHDACYLHVYSP